MSSTCRATRASSTSWSRSRTHFDAVRRRRTPSCRWRSCPMRRCGTPRTRCWTPTGADGRSDRSRRSRRSRASRRGRGWRRAIFDRLVDADQLSLPWLPPAGSVQVSLDDWRWGIRAAQRVLFLELDLLRLAGSPDLLVANRGPIDEAIAMLDALATTCAAGPRSARRRWSSATSMTTTWPRSSRRWTGCSTCSAPRSEDALEARDERVPRRDRAAADRARACSTGWQTRPWTRVTFFVWRALAIEVIRRAFVADHEVDSAQTLRFAQLTPVAPCPVMTAKPFNDRGPDSPGDKLTGIHLGHFSAFYRASWRANDFMWGRLDGAVRVVDLMVDAGDSHRTCPLLAEALVPHGSGRRRGGPARARRRGARGRGNSGHTRTIPVNSGRSSPT